MLPSSVFSLHRSPVAMRLPVPPSAAHPPLPLLSPAACLPAGRRWAAVTLSLALLFSVWEAVGGDRWLADMAGSAAGFPLRNQWLLTDVVHGDGRLLAWALALALCLGVWWPVGALRRLDLAQRLQLAGTVLLSVALVSLLKSVNPAACPWSLTAYGGLVEPVSHWAWWAKPMGGRGGCFPAGHASAGFAFISGYFVFRPVAPALARRWLLGALAAGLVLGVAQQWRGAHFMSHTLWSGWLCWCLAWAADSLRQRFAPAPLSLAAPATAAGQ